MRIVLDLDIEEFISPKLEDYIKAQLPIILNEYFKDNQVELNKIIREVVKGQLKATCNEVLQGKAIKEILTDKIMQSLNSKNDSI